MAVIKWQECYATGVAPFDQDHQKLVALINDVYEAIRKGDGDERIGELIQPFLVYAESHFAREESAMQRYAFSGYEKHREEHQAFRNHMDSLLKRAEREKVDGMALDLLNVMRQWLLNHILVTDKEYASTLQSVDLD